jgi:hypothetical protein
VGAVVTAIGDSGSCTSWCIHDSVELEKKGVPTVTICTTAFERLGRGEARTLGMPDLPLAIVDHPFAGESLGA